MKHNMQDLQEDNRDLDQMVEQLRQGQENAAAAGKMLSDDEQGRLKAILAETEQRFREVELQNRRLQQELERKEGV